jgi:hypothetical protein
MHRGLWLTPLSTILAILWRSVLVVEEHGVPGENQQLAASQWQSAIHNVISSTPRLIGFQTTVVLICTDCICKCKSTYHTITTTTVPMYKDVFLKFVNSSQYLWRLNMEGGSNTELLTQTRPWKLHTMRIENWWTCHL